MAQGDTLETERNKTGKILLPALDQEPEWKLIRLKISLTPSEVTGFRDPDGYETQQGTDLRYIQVLLDHNSQKTTEIYAFSMFKVRLINWIFNFEMYIIMLILGFCICVLTGS